MKDKINQSKRELFTQVGALGVGALVGGQAHAITREEAKNPSPVKISTINVRAYKNYVVDNDWTMAFQKAIDNNPEPIILMVPPDTYHISHIKIHRNNPVTVLGYGATLIATSEVEDSTGEVEAMIDASGESHRFIGFNIAPLEKTLVPLEVVKAKAFKLWNNDRSSVMMTFRDLTLYNMFQGIHFKMDGNKSVACYRHTIENCNIRAFGNESRLDKSFAISFDGNVSGNSSGNDSKIIGGVLAGYQNNVIVRNSIGTKLIGVSIDGANQGILYDGGGSLSLVSCYLEYNDYHIQIQNSPWMLMLISSTFSTLKVIEAINGDLINNSRPTFVGMPGVDDTLLPAVADLVETLPGGITQQVCWNTIRWKQAYTQRYVDLNQIQANVFGLRFEGLADEDDFAIRTDPNHHLLIGGEDNVWARFDEYGNLYAPKVLPSQGVFVFVDGDGYPSVGGGNVFETDNSGPTSIHKLRYGEEGHVIYIKANDNNTTLVQSEYIKLKSGGDYTLAVDETITLACFSAPHWNECVFYQV